MEVVILPRINSEIRYDDEQSESTRAAMASYPSLRSSEINYIRDTLLKLALLFPEMAGWSPRDCTVILYLATSTVPLIYVALHTENYSHSSTHLYLSKLNFSYLHIKSYFNENVPQSNLFSPNSGL